MLGLDIEPLIGTSVFDLIHPEDRRLALEAFHDVIEHGQEADRVECRLRHARGGWRSVEVLGTNLFDDPSVQGLVISARDLTDRRRAEADLREAQERFRSAFEHAPIGMALVSLDGRLFRVNRALVGILGRSEHELLRAEHRRAEPSRRRRAGAAGDRRSARRRESRATSTSSASCTTTATRSGCR